MPREQQHMPANRIRLRGKERRAFSWADVVDFFRGASSEQMHTAISTDLTQIG